MRGFLYVLAALAYGLFGGLVYRILTEHGVSKELALFLLAAGLIALAWHIAAWLVWGRNW